MHSAEKEPKGWKTARSRTAVVPAVCIANLASYLSHYVFAFNGISALNEILEDGYIIALGYLVFTNFRNPHRQRNFTKTWGESKRLPISIIAVRIITTLLVAVNERIFYPATYFYG